MTESLENRGLRLTGPQRLCDASRRGPPLQRKRSPFSLRVSRRYPIIPDMLGISAPDSPATAATQRNVPPTATVRLHTLGLASPPDLAGDGAAQRHPPFRLDILVAIYAVAAAAPAAVAAPRGGELRKDRVACRRVRVLQLACPVEGGDPAACSVSGAPREYRGWCRNLAGAGTLSYRYRCAAASSADWSGVRIWCFASRPLARAHGARMRLLDVRDRLLLGGRLFLRRAARRRAGLVPWQGRGGGEPLAREPVRRRLGHAVDRREEPLERVDQPRARPARSQRGVGVGGEGGPSPARMGPAAPVEHRVAVDKHNAPLADLVRSGR